MVKVWFQNTSTVASILSHKMSLCSSKSYNSFAPGESCESDERKHGDVGQDMHLRPPPPLSGIWKTNQRKRKYIESAYLFGVALE
jgi:hypothetical protein